MLKQVSFLLRLTPNSLFQEALLEAEANSNAIGEFAINLRRKTLITNSNPVL